MDWSRNNATQKPLDFTAKLTSTSINDASVLLDEIHLEWQPTMNKRLFDSNLSWDAFNVSKGIKKKDKHHHLAVDL